MDKDSSHLKLILAAQVSIDLESCWLEGYDASNSDISKNPYRLGSKAHNYWEDGFNSSLFGEEPLFKTSPRKLKVKNNSIHWFYTTVTIIGLATLSLSYVFDFVA